MFFDSYPAWSSAQEGSKSEKKFISLNPELAISGSGSSSNVDSVLSTEISTPSLGSPSASQEGTQKTGLNPLSAEWTGGQGLDAAASAAANAAANAVWEFLPAADNAGAEKSPVTADWIKGSPGKAEAAPEWETGSAVWDYDNAAKLAEQLLLLQENNALPDMKAEFGDQFGASDVAGESLCPNPRFKTEFCRNFREKGTCLYGDLCQFAHGRNELRQDAVRHNKYKTKLCQKFWIHGYCAYGPRCNFIHQEKEGFHEEEKTPHPGFKPFNVSGLRKTSESSVDSGVEAGFSHPPPRLDWRKFPPPTPMIGNGQARERADLIGLKTRGFQEYNFNLPNEINRNLHMMNNNNQSHLKDNEDKARMGRFVSPSLPTPIGGNRAASPPEEHRLGGSVVPPAESRLGSLVPHPEHNPISALNNSLTGLWI